MKSLEVHACLCVARFEVDEVGVNEDGVGYGTGRGDAGDEGVGGVGAWEDVLGEDGGEEGGEKN